MTYTHTYTDVCMYVLNFFGKDLLHNIDICIYIYIHARIQLREPFDSALNVYTHVHHTETKC